MDTLDRYADWEIDEMIYEEMRVKQVSINEEFEGNIDKDALHEKYIVDEEEEELDFDEDGFITQEKVW